MNQDDYIKKYYKEKTLSNIAKELNIAEITVWRKAKKLGLSKLIDSVEDFINKAQKIHGDKYDYSNIEYTDSQTKIKILCLKHGEFEIRPSKHIFGQKCYKCSKEDTIAKLSLNKENFIKGCSRIHNNKYDYSLVECNSQYNKIKIICPKHGIFEQVAKNHRRNDCPKCSKELNSGWTKEDWNKRLIKGKTLKLYYIKCWNDEELFYKIGLTCKNNIRDRFSGNLKMPYNYEILNFIEGDIDLYDIEVKFKKQIREIKDQYIPKIKFSGSIYECFSGKFIPSFDL